MEEEYTRSKGIEWAVFIISTIAMFGFLWFLPEWVWVVWPFQLTALAALMGRL